MTRTDIEKYIAETFGIVPDHPFKNEYAETDVFRHKDTQKWFALCMHVRADRLGYESDEWLDVVTMKSDPILIDGIVGREGFHRAYHMNKRQWLTVELNENTSEGEVKNLLDISFEMTDRKK